VLLEWKVDPRRSISGVPQDAPGFVTRSSVKDPLSADDYIKHIRQLQEYQGSVAHPLFIEFYQNHGLVLRRRR